MKYVIQDLIDNGKLEVDNPFAIPNQDLGIYQNPLPHHATNNILWKTNDNQVTRKWDPNGTGFISMISVATIAQKAQEKKDGISINPQHRINTSPQIPRPQPSRILVKGALQ